MTPRAWALVSDLFQQALDGTPEERARLLERLRAEDRATADEVASLLDAHDRPGEFLPELPDAPVLPDLAGRSLGAYRLIRLLGAGGSGAVYLAERSDGAFSRHVAVKLLSAAFLHARDRFLREREFLGRLEHPNIVRLLDAGATADHVPYLVMDYVDGVPIDRHCAGRGVTLDEALDLLRQVCAGVAHAHQHLIVHCDIKPENILVTAEGVVKLLDFGIARLLDPAGPITRLRPATPAYASPEQLRGHAITTAADVYQVGVIANQVLAGHGRLPRDLENILAKATADEPARRYATAEQLADDLQAFRDGFPVRARADSVAYRLRRAAGRHPLAFSIAAVLGVGLAAATVVSTWQARVAARRFDELRTFARAVVFDVNDALAPIPGTTGPRKLVVETALHYLDRLNQDRVSDLALREELAAAYIRIGKVQGGAFLPNLGDAAGAVSSFRKAIATTGDDPATPALERVRIDALINTALLAVDPIAGAPGFDAAIRAAEARLAADPGDIASLRLLADAYHGRATVSHLTNDVPEHLAMAMREVEAREQLRSMASPDWQDAASLARAYGQQALALEQQGDYEAAVAALARARATVEDAILRSEPNQMLSRGLAEIGSRAATSFLALGRTSEAAAEVEKAIALLQPIVTSDPLNVQYRADLSYAWLRLGDVRQAQGALADALDLHRRALAVRRERAERFPGFVFVPWELARSLNTVGELLLMSSPAHADEAAALFREAVDVGRRAIAEAPSYTQVRRQVAIAEDGLARAAEIRGGPHAAAAAAFFARSAATWREVVARSRGDARAAEALRQAEARLRTP